MIGYWDVLLWYLREGRTLLVSILSKPINPLLYMYGMNLFPGGVIKFLLMVAGFIFLVNALHFSISLSFILLLSLATLSWINITNTALACFVAFDKAAEPIIRLLWIFLSYGDMPLTELKGIGGFLLTYIVPIAFVAAVPAEALRSNAYPLTEAFLVYVATLLLSWLSWKLAMKRFEAIGG